jgi:tetratricopeptide (TPR) repeat protein
VNIVDYLLEQGSLLEASRIEAPRNIRQMIERNLQRLNADEQRMLEAASVVGAEFSAAAIAAALERPLIEIEVCCTGLARREQFVRAEAASLWPDGTMATGYRFLHALYEEVLCERVPVGSRAELHRRIAEREEAAYGDRCDEIAAELANHYKQSLNINKAVHFLGRAAEQAAERSALVEAESHLREAIGLLSALQPSSDRDLLELGLQTTLARVLNGTSCGAQEREEPLRRAYRLCERVADSGKILPALFQITQFNIARMRLSEARELAGRALALAPSSGDPVLEAGAWYNAGESSLWYGDLRNSHTHLERVLALIDEISPNTLIRACSDYWFLAATLSAVTELLFGKLTRVIDLETQISERATSSSWPYDKVVGIVFGALPAQVRGEWNQVFERIELARPICDEFGFLEGAGLAKQFGGWASFWLGERARGLQEMSEAVVQLRELGALTMSTWRLVLLAEAQIELESYDAASATVTDAFNNLEQTKEGWCEAEVHRVAGELERRKAGGDLAVAEQRFRQAIDVARNQGSKWWELRAVKSLARLLRDTNRRDEARSKLTEIYGWFTEGFDTADLKDATALLNELSR